MNGLDLLALIEELEAKGRHANFVAKVKQATSVASGHQDLRSASDALKIVRDSSEKRKQSLSIKEFTPAPPAEGTISGALLAHAVILYARATETKPIDRLNWFGRTLLSDEQRSWHKEVMDYRDKVLAHFGLGSSLEDGPAISQALVLRVPEIGKYPMISYVENRANTRGRFTENLCALVEHIIPIAHNRYNQRVNEVWAAFNKEIIPDETIGSEIRRSVFNPSKLGLESLPMFDDDESEELSSHFVIKKLRAGKNDKQ